MITETIYKSTDNVISLELRSGGVPVDISSATKITIDVGNSLLSSATATNGAFDFTTYGSVGRLDLKLGFEADVLTMRQGQYKARLKVYDLTYPRGRVWDDLIIEVK